MFSKRESDMKKIIVALMFVYVMVGVSHAQTTLDFEGLTTSSGTTFERLHNTSPYYGGFRWNDNFYLIDDATYLDNPTLSTDNSYASPLGEYAIFNGNGFQNLFLRSDALWVSNPFKFNFIGAHFTAWADGDAHWNNGTNWSSALSITIHGYDGINLVKSVSMTLSTDQYDWLQADINGIDRLVFEWQPSSASATSAWYLMDNFTYQVAVVPEPVSMILFVVGGATLGFRRFRRKLKK